MLDSSPPTPPPKKLKRTASAASLPSPPPSVEHLRKRTISQRHNNHNSDTDLGSDDDAEDATSGEEVLVRKLLFPVGPRATDDLHNPFLDDPKSSDARDQLALDVASSPSARRTALPASPPPSMRKTAKAPTAQPKTFTPVAEHWKCSASELPVPDAENNPFLSNSPPRPKARRPRSPCEPAEPQTLTYVFRGIKTLFPNPNYNLPDSALERSRLPLDHTEYSPPPTRAPKRLFPEAYPSVEDPDAEDDEASHSDSGDSAAGLRTPESKPRMSRVFVDEAGNPLPDSGPQGIRGKTMDVSEIGRMAVGPIRGRG